MSRLSLGALPAAARPPVDPRAVETGIVHLGIGAFHRARQAVYTQAAMAAIGDLSWGICGVTQRSATVLEQLGPKDGSTPCSSARRAVPRPRSTPRSARCCPGRGGGPRSSAAPPHPPSG